MLSVEKYIRFNLIISSLEKSLQKYKNSNMTEYDLRSTHILCLISLKNSKGLTAAELIDTCSVNKALISRITADLFKRGYIEYTPDSADKKYKKRMVLTDEGRAVTDDIERKINRAVDFVSGTIPDEKLETFYEVLTTIETNITSLAKQNN